MMKHHQDIGNYIVQNRQSSAVLEKIKGHN